MSEITPVATNSINYAKMPDCIFKRILEKIDSERPGKKGQNNDGLLTQEESGMNAGAFKVLQDQAKASFFEEMVTLNFDCSQGSKEKYTFAVVQGQLVIDIDRGFNLDNRIIVNRQEPGTVYYLAVGGFNQYFLENGTSVEVKLPVEYTFKHQLCIVKDPEIFYYPYIKQAFEQSMAKANPEQKKILEKLEKQVKDTLGISKP